MEEMSADTGNPTFGILGAGNVGTVLARLAIDAKYRVLMSGSGDPSRISRTILALNNEVLAMTAAEVATTADIVILALPFSKHPTLPVDALRGKLVIDATNYWWTAEGIREEYADPRTSTSEIVQAFLPDSRVVKAFNHMGYLQLEEAARPPGTPGRKSLAIAGDDPADVDSVAILIDAVGFDPVVAGPLAEGVRMEPQTELFGSDVDATEIHAMIEGFPNSARGIVVARARARKIALAPCAARSMNI